MTDGIIKGTGNSRYLKGPADILSKYPTWEAAAAALAAGTFPVDFNGINPAGWTTQGTKLNKANLLTDALCTALGLATTTTPTQAMEKLNQLKAETKVVSYTGTGKHGENNPCSITFPFAPIMVLFLGHADSGRFTTSFGYTLTAPVIVSTYLTTSFKVNCGFALGSYVQQYYGRKSADGKTFDWYNTTDDPAHQLNDVSQTYYFLGIS